MSVSAVNSASTAGATAPTSRGMASLRSEDFYKILVTELQQQDPLEPTKTSDMIGEVSQIRNIELSSQLNAVLTQFARQQRVSGAGELLGRYVTASVTAADGSTQEVSGLVTGIHFDPTGAMVLELDDGQSVLASDVTRIATQESAVDPALATSAAATGTPSADGQTTPATDDSTATDADKPGTAKSNSARTQPQRAKKLLPWLSLDGLFHL